MPKKYTISKEVFKFPYSGRRIEDKEYLSEVVCSNTIKIRRVLVFKTKFGIVYLILGFSILSATQPAGAIGLTPNS
jgi:hypothetical protein